MKLYLFYTNKGECLTLHSEFMANCIQLCVDASLYYIQKTIIHLYAKY